jgi:inhibitor of cysteine peptidase
MRKALWITGIAIVIGAFAIYNYFTYYTSNVAVQIPYATSYAPALKDWQIQFTEPMNPETFTKETVAVVTENGDKISVTFQWNNDYTVLTIQSPDKGWDVGEKYEIVISESVTTAQGDMLTTSFTHSFQAVAELPKIENHEQLVALLKERMENQSHYFNDVSIMESVTDGAAKSADSSSSNNTATSKTNVQVDGIDEGDRIKVDGDYLYFVRENDIVIASTNGKASRVKSTIHEQDYYIREIFIQDDLLITIGQTHQSIREKVTSNNTSSKRTSADFIRPYYAQQTTVYFYDISDKENPKRLREFTMEGNVTASRKMNGFLYLVANNFPPYHIFREDEKSDNIDPRPFVIDTAVSIDPKPVDFENMHFFPDSNEQSFMLISAIDLNDMKKEHNMKAYLGSSNQIYMSKEHLYTAIHKYKLTETTGPEGSKVLQIAEPADTQIIQFHIQDENIAFNAKTIVNGTLINQFAMDERNNTFRVATTKGNSWDEKNPSTNNIYTFDINLHSLGKVEGLAEGERIYSVRFMEDVAYMVTFKQVDPLFVIDLKDAKNPRVLGELKIPGFSNYLHPLDDNHVIGFGQHTALEKVEWRDEPVVRPKGLKISVFDVTDPTNPIEKFVEILGQGGSYSEVNHNHRALYQHPDPEKNLFGFQANLYETKTVQKGDAVYQEQAFVFEGAFLYEISPETGITLKDTITHQQNMQEKNKYPDWQTSIKRMVSVGDLLYTLSFDKLKVYDINSKKVIHEIDLPKRKQRY